MQSVCQTGWTHHVAQNSKIVRPDFFDTVIIKTMDNNIGVCFTRSVLCCALGS